MSLKIEHLKIAYNGNEVVKDFNLDIEGTEFVALLGPSGSGKTSILRTLAGLLRQQSGKMSIDGKDISNLHPSDRNIAMVFQNYALYPHLKVYENIALNLRMKKMSKGQIDKKVKDVAKMLSIDHLLDKYPRETSGGQAQRVGLARAMVRDPGVYLMDEPLSNLDAKFRDEMRYELRRFYELSRRTVIYVTHDQLEAMSMADRVVVISQGENMQEGTPKELYDNPANTFVASFVGSPPMNLFEARREGKKDNLYRVTGKDAKTGFSVEVDDYSESDRITVGFRPSDLKIKKNGEVETVLERVEFLGPYLNLHVRIGESSVAVRVSREGTGVDKMIEKESGTKVRFTIDPASIYLFNTSTGNRLYDLEGRVAPLLEMPKGAVYE